MILDLIYSAESFEYLRDNCSEPLAIEVRYIRLAV